MESTLWILTLSAASIGFFHTILGPDHFIPFILLSKSRNWSIKKTMFITSLCGLGHVGGSVLLGMLGILMGWSLNNITLFENSRGNIAAWLLIIFGGLYMIWGIVKAIKNKPHSHWHSHISGPVHKHPHKHTGEHTHVHEAKDGFKMTPMVLFLIFIFGPCEALIPMLIYPAAQESTFGLFIVIVVFGITTIVTMLGIVYVSVYGIKMISLGRFERFSHAIAGAFIFMCGIGVQFLGL